MAYYGYEPSKVAVSVGQGVITSVELGTDAVNTIDILNDAVTPAKIDDDGTGFQMGTLGLGGAVSGAEKLTVTGTSSFSGAITGNLTGNASGTSATVTGGTQASITSTANLVTVGTITTGVWNAGAVTSSGGISGTTGTFSDDVTIASSKTLHIGGGDGAGILNVRQPSGTSLLKQIVLDTSTATQDWAIGTDQVGNYIDFVILKEYSSWDSTPSMRISKETEAVTFAGDVTRDKITISNDNVLFARNGSYSASRAWRWRVDDTAWGNFDLRRSNGEDNTIDTSVLLFDGANSNATFGGNITRDGDSDVVIGNSTLQWNVASNSGSRSWMWRNDGVAWGDYVLRRSNAHDNTIDTAVLSFNSSGNATFAGSVVTGGDMWAGGVVTAYDSVSGAYIASFTNTHNSEPYGINVHYSGNSVPSNTTSRFITCTTGGSIKMWVHSSGDIENANNSYGQYSDERIKDNITDANSQWDDIKALRVRNFEMKNDIEQFGAGEKVQIGVVAQEVEASGMNGLVNESSPSEFQIENCGIEEDDTVKAVKYSVLYMKAIKCLQEAMTRIEALENA